VCVEFSREDIQLQRVYVLDQWHATKHDEAEHEPRRRGAIGDRAP